VVTTSVFGTKVAACVAPFGLERCSACTGAVRRCRGDVVYLVETTAVLMGSAGMSLSSATATHTVAP